MVTELGAQATLEDGLDHLRQESTLPGQPQIAGINLGHHVIQQARLDHVVDHLPSRDRLRRRRSERRLRLLLLIGHRHVHTSSSLGNLVHRPSDTPASGRQSST